MNMMLHNLKMKAKNSTDIFLVLLKIISGMILGLTISLSFQFGIGFGEIALLFMITLITSLFYYLTRGFRYLGVLVLNLVLILTAILLRMYIYIAPGQ